MDTQFAELEKGRKVYFASDFHLGAPNPEQSRSRELKITRWLDMVKQDAAAIFLVGDIFDFWFEYKYAIPKGYVRFLGKIAEVSDLGIPIVFFAGNHDMWMFDYFPSELNVLLERKPKSYQIGSKLFHIGHGDGLGPGDAAYKVLRRIFDNKLCQWLFHWLHPNVGMGIARAWSRYSRVHNLKIEEGFDAENEWILTYCREMEAREHKHYYVFGHRHISIDYPLAPDSRYINLGEWVTASNYGVFDGENLELKAFDA